MQRCWKEIQRNCSEEDPQREGHISTVSFLGGWQTKDISYTTLSRSFYMITYMLTTLTVCVAEILQSLNINLSQVQFEHLAMKFDIMNNGGVSYHNFLRHFLLNLRPAETKRTFERCKLPLPVTPVKKKHLLLYISVSVLK